MTLLTISPRPATHAHVFDSFRARWIAHPFGQCWSYHVQLKRVTLLTYYLVFEIYWQTLGDVFSDTGENLKIKFSVIQRGVGHVQGSCLKQVWGYQTNSFQFYLIPKSEILKYMSQYTLFAFILLRTGPSFNNSHNAVIIDFE